MKRKIYSDKEKAEIMEFIINYDKQHKRGGQSQAVKKYNVTAQTIINWFSKPGKDKNTGKKKLTSADEYYALRNKFGTDNKIAGYLGISPNYLWSLKKKLNVSTGGSGPGVKGKLNSISQYDSLKAQFGTDKEIATRLGITPGYLSSLKKALTGTGPEKPIPAEDPEKETPPVTVKTIHHTPRVGLYVDVSNINFNGGYGMKYDTLVEFACRGNGAPTRLNAYLGYHSERAEVDAEYREKQEGFFNKLRSFGYRIITKNLKSYKNEDHTVNRKANLDIELCVDMLSDGDKLDRVVLVTGDGDFLACVNALQNKGCRVEVIGFDNVSGDLREKADYYLSGYLIPNLLPALGGKVGIWGELGSRVRGICHTHNNENGYGYMRYMTSISPDFWKVDARQDDAPFKEAFFHNNDVKNKVKFDDLPSDKLVFEFELGRNNRSDTVHAAKHISLIRPHRFQDMK